MTRMWDMVHGRAQLPAHMTRQDALDAWYDLRCRLKEEDGSED